MIARDRYSLISGTILILVCTMLRPGNRAEAQIWQKLASPATSPLPSLYAVSFITPATGYVCGEQSGAGVLYRTTDAGGGWVRVSLPGTPGAINDVLFPSSSVGMVAGNNGYVAISIDGGFTWLDRSVPASVWPGGGHIQGMYFKDANIGFVVGTTTSSTGPRMARTVNSGVTWTDVPMTGPANNLYDVDFFDANRGVAVGTGNPPRKSSTSDGGLTWEPNANMGSGAPPSLSFYSVDAIDGTTTAYAAGGMVVGVNYPEVRRSTDAGISWQPTAAQPATNRALSGIIAITRNLIFVSGRDGTLLRTTNGGGAWIPEQPTPQTSYDLRRFGRTPDDWLYVVGLGGSIYRTRLVADPVFAQQSIDFEKLCPGRDRTLTLSIRNGGGSPLVIDSIVVTQPVAPGVVYSVVSHPDTIPSDSTGEVVVRAAALAGTSPAAFSGRLRIYNNDENRTGADRDKQITLAAVVTTRTVSVSAGPFDAGRVPLGTQRSLTLADLLTTSGECSTAITSVRMAQGTDFRVVAPIPGSVPVAGKVSINLLFAPTAPCVRYDTVIIVYDAVSPASPIRVPVSGTGLAKSFATNPADTLHFGGVLIGSDEVRNLLLENRNFLAECLEETHVTSFTIEGPDAADFSTTFTTGSGRAIPPGGEIAIPITARPGAEGIRTATAIIGHDAVAGGSDTVVLIVNGLRPELVSASPEIRFAPTGIGERRDSSVSDFIINLSSTAADITGFRIVGAHAGDFTYGGPAPTYSIPVGGRRTILVSFHPSGAGTRTATLELLTTARPIPLSIALIGNAARASGGTLGTAMLLQSTEVNTCQDTVAHGFIYNPGDVPLRITGARIEAHPGGLPGDLAAFTLVAPSIPPELVIGPHDSADVALKFCPTETRIYRARLVLDNNTDAGSWLIDLTGSGRLPSIITSDSIIFARTRVLTQRDTLVRGLLANGNDAAITVDSITITGGDVSSFTVGAPATPFVLAAHGESDVALRFHPAKRGTNRATLTVHTSAGSWPVMVGGPGIYPVLEITSSDLQNLRARIGTTQSIAVDITNRDDGASDSARIERATLNGSAAFAKAGADPFPAVLNPGESVRMLIWFTPDHLCEHESGLVLRGEGMADIYGIADSTVVLSGSGVAPLVSTRRPEISFGLRALGSQSDSVLNDFLGNIDFSGAANGCLDSTTIDSLVIAGPDAASFLLLAPGDPYSPHPLAASAFQPLTIRFQPTTVGASTAELLVYFDGHADSVRRIALLGANSALALEYGPFRNMIAIDFGDVITGTFRDSLFTIVNMSSEPVTIDEMRSTLPQVMSIISPAAPFTLAPQVPKTVRVQFAPPSSGMYRAQVVIRSGTLTDSLFTLTGNGVDDTSTAAFTVHADLGSDLVGSPGNVVEIPLALQGDVIDAGFSELDVTLRFTRTVLKPVNVLPVQNGVSSVINLPVTGTGRDGRTSFRLRTTGTFAPGTVARIAFQILLPDTLETTVYIDSIGVPQQPDISVTADSIRFTISDFCDPEHRLIRFDSLFSFGSKPNPASRMTRFEYLLPATVDAQLSIYDAGGHEMARLAEGVHQPGRYSVPFDASTLSTGTYYCVLTAGRFSKTLILRVQE